MKIRICFAILFVIALTAASSAANLLLKNVVIYDGSGRKPFNGDVRIKGDQITEVAKSLHANPGEEVQDEHGLALSPGFIDMHSHADRGIFDDLDAENVIRQGITTVFVGQDGDSEFPLADFLGRLEKTPPSVNFATMVGHGTLREQVLGSDLLRPSTPDELKKLKQLLDQEMHAGAFGLSSGLEYDSGHFATTDEMVELSKVVAQDGGFYISHVRDEGDKVFDSFAEIIQIGKNAGLPVEISHIKLATVPVWHTARDRMPKIFAEAKHEGVDLKADVYPYTFWQSTIRVIVLDRDFFNPEKVEKVIAENGSADHIRLTRYDPEPAVAGKNLDEIAKIWQLTPVQAYMRIVKATLPDGGNDKQKESVIVTSMSDDDLRWFIAQPRIMFCTDGALHDKHPRGAGSFPRILGRYVRDEKVLTLEEAIHKATALPAEQLGLRDRGHIAAGYVADLVVFDPTTVIDGSTVEHPEAPPTGIPSVMVSGEWVVDNGKVTGMHSGKILRHTIPPRLTR
jgi:N-acyl-D-amino-acid deacylase